MKLTSDNRDDRTSNVLSRFGIDTFVAGGTIRQSRHGASRAIVRSCWTLDYTLYAGTRCRIGSANALWQTRDKYAAHLYGPNVPYWEDTSTIELPGSSLWICFGGGSIWELEHLFEADRRYAIFNDPEQLLHEPLRQTATDWNTQYLADAPRGWRILSLLFGIIDLLSSARPTGDGLFRLIAPDTIGTAGFVQRVDRLLARKLNQTVSLDELARELGVSTSTLSHRYRERTGMAPMQRHMQLRMRKVTGMLMAGEPLKNIADQLGFCDVPHLSNAFQRHFGLSPRAWLLNAEC